MNGRRRPMERLGDLLPHSARQLGLEGELRKARAMTTWDDIVAQRVPAAAGACRLVAVDGPTLVIEADQPIVAQELRLRSRELLAAFSAAPGGFPAVDLRLTVRHV